jgi:hypothetical protein
VAQVSRPVRLKQRDWRFGKLEIANCDLKIVVVAGK